MNKRNFILSLSSFGLWAVASNALASGAPKKKAGGANYTQLPMLTIATSQNGRRRGTLSVELGLYAETPNIVDVIKLSQPRLMDAYNTALRPYANALNASSLVDLNYMTTLLQTATDRVLGAKGAKVLLGSVVLN